MTDFGKNGVNVKRTLATLLLFLHVTGAVSVSVASSLTLRSLNVQSKSEQSADRLDSLRERITAHIGQQKFAAAQWGVKIVSLDTGKTIFEHNAQKFFNPASNAKLYTAAMALDSLGLDYRIKTSLYSNARPDASGTLKSDLIVYGRGDPTMAARLNGGDYFKGFDPLITQLTNAGVRRIEGDLVADESYFTGPPFGSGWQWDDLQAYYGAEVSSLTVDDNALDLFVKPAERVGMPCRITTGPPTTFVTFINRTQTAPKGSETHIVVYRPVAENIIYVSGTLAIDSSGYYAAVAVHNPASLFVTLLKDALAARGIVVSGRTRVIDWKYREVTPVDFTRFIELGSVESMPLGDIVRETLKPSQNLYAQLLLLQVGARVRTRSGKKDSIRESETPGSFSTTEALGINSMNDFLARIGVKQGDVLLEEGSGLSRLDVITPEATVALLSYASRSSWAEIYRNALPIAAVDGTLQNRMKGTAAAGNVRAKTGTLRYVHALSGFVTTAAGEHLVFSIMLNNYNNREPAALTGAAGTRARHAPPAAPRDELDAIAIMLAGFTGHSQ